jgi:hypothetical protein
MLTLVKLTKTDKSPYEQWPLFKTIWSDPAHQAKAEEAVVKYLENFETETGPILIVYKDQVPIGITGLYDARSEISELKQHVGLRWHGLLPAYRKQGLSRQVLYQLSLYIALNYTNKPRFIVEMVPPDRVDILKYFISMGFVDCGIPVLSGTEKPWRVFAAALPLGPVPLVKPRYIGQPCKE